MSQQFDQIPPPNWGKTRSLDEYRWYYRVAELLNGVLQIGWSQVVKTGSRLSDIVTRPHSDLQDIEGTGTRHITTAENAEITALDGISAGIVAKTADATYSARTITGTTGEIEVTNGAGTAGNPKIELPDVISTPRKFGTADNNTEIGADGTVKLNGTATVWDDMLPSSVTIDNTGANFPSFTAYAGNMRAYEFVGTGALLKEMNLGFQFSHSQKLTGTITITPHLHLYIRDAAVGGDIKFYCEYTWAAKDQKGAIAATTISGTLTRTANQGIDNNIVLSFGNVTGTDKGLSSIFMCRIYRDPTDVADTYAGSVWLKSADIHYERDGFGSATETSK